MRLIAFTEKMFIKPVSYQWQQRYACLILAMRFLSYIFLFFLSTQVFSQIKKEYHDAKQTQLKSETDYYKGMPHGKHVEYYPSGKISRQGFYNYGKEDSVWTFFYEDGTKKAVERYFRGKKDGTNTYYFKSGKIAQITKYADDLADSTWTS